MLRAGKWKEGTDQDTGTKIKLREWHIGTLTSKAIKTTTALTPQN